MISNLIVFPVNFLIVTLFRKSRARTKRPSRIEAALKAAPTASVDDVKPEMGGIWHTNKPFVNTKADGPLSRPLSACSQKSDQSVDGQAKRRTTEAKRTTKKKKFELPWWCRIAAWVLLWLTTFAAAAFVTFYAIQFGDRKTKKWITSLLISFLTSVFVTQPAKVRDSTKEGRKQGNVLFNDALNTFYLRLYGVRHMVKNHSKSERGNPLPP